MAHHPSEQDLALLAGGDMGRLQRILPERHVRGCAEYRRLREDAAAMELPDVNWALLEAEMRANIHLGFEAGQCVKAARPAAWSWDPRMAVALACLLVLVSAGFFLRGTKAPMQEAPVAVAHSAGSEPVLESTNSGLELHVGEGSLTLLNHHGVIAHQTASARGEIRARYVDGDAGTVTINNVYLQ